MPETTSKARRARKKPLSRPEIIQKAIRMADEAGVDALSMRKLAGVLRVEAMSLYHHVKNKDDLLDGMVEVVVGEIAVPTVGGQWKAELRKRATSAHAVLMAHPWAAMLLMSRVNIGPMMLRYVDATLGCLFDAGFSYVLADHIWNALDSFVYGFTLHSLNFPFAPDEYKGAAEEFIPQLPAGEYPHLVGLSEEVMAGRHDGLQSLTFGLELLLEGFEQRFLRRETP